jgi:transglutaminase-like putative cysteine protease
MSIHVALTHETRYRYDRLATLGPQVVRLRPAPHSRTRILSYALRVEPAEHFLNWQQDPLGNYLARIVVPGKTREFRLQVDLVAEMAVFNPFDFFLEPEAEHYPFAYEPRIAKELEPYLELEPAGPLLTEWLR